MTSQKERVYLNVNMNFDKSKISIPEVLATPAIYNQTFTESLLSKDSSNYSLSIVRMTVPTNFIPIKIMPAIVNPDDIKDIDYLSYYIVFRYNDIEYKRNLRWDNLNYAPFPSPPDLQNPRNYQYYSLYSIQQFCDIVNKTMGELMNDVYTFILPQPQPGFIFPQPYLSFDASTYRFSMSVHEIFTTDNTYGSTIDILFDASLYANTDFFNTKYFKYQILVLGILDYIMPLLVFYYHPMLMVYPVHTHLLILGYLRDH
jgi:hypothetical protein